jgi:hypothetical protein
MKRVLISLFISIFGFSGMAGANMQLELWWVQNRKYENGTALNKAAFAMKDQSDNYILQNVLSSMELYDPEGIKVQAIESGFGGSYQTVNLNYDSNNGRWFSGATLRDESWYFIDFDSPLKIGDYHLVVKDQSGIQYEDFFKFNGLQNIQQISSDTFCAFKDGEGNLLWTWEGPAEYFQNVSTSIRTYATAYDENGEYLGETYIKVPTHLGWAFAPANLLQQLEQVGGKTFKIGVQIRSNDNNNRTYSNSIDWQEANACNCDVDGDLKTGIVEAIFSLQVAADIR